MLIAFYVVGIYIKIPQTISFLLVVVVFPLLLAITATSKLFSGQLSNRLLTINIAPIFSSVVIFLIMGQRSAETEAYGIIILFCLYTIVVTTIAVVLLEILKARLRKTM